MRFVLLCLSLALMVPSAVAQPTRLGDLDGDGQATIADLVAYQYDADANRATPAPSVALYADINQDGAVDGVDIQALVEAILDGAALPEPPAPSIDDISPFDGEDNVSAAREVVIRLDRAIDPAQLTDTSVTLTANGVRIAGRRVVSAAGDRITFYPDQDLPAATEVRVALDAATVRGTNGFPLDGDGDGSPGDDFTSDFRTIALTRIPGTNLFGFVKDALSQTPIEGVTIRVDSFSDATAVTDANGRFLLENLPSPDVFVHIDGTTATNPPQGFRYPAPIGKPFHTIPGQEVQIHGPDGEPFDIFLPRQGDNDAQNLSADAETPIGFGDGGLALLQNDILPEVDETLFNELEIRFPPGSAVDDNGNAATEAVVLPVPPDRLPAPLPPGQDPRLVISVQVPGATAFDEPIPFSIPNLDGLAPGSRVAMRSFDHDAGRWRTVATATVSPDGRTIDSDPGQGLRWPGWHFISPNPDGQGDIFLTPCLPDERSGWVFIDDDNDSVHDDADPFGRGFDPTEDDADPFEAPISDDPPATPGTPEVLKPDLPAPTPSSPVPPIALEPGDVGFPPSGFVDDDADITPPIPPSFPPDLGPDICAEPGYDIHFLFVDDSVSDQVKSIYRQAADRWEQIIVGDVPDVVIDLESFANFGIDTLGLPNRDLGIDDLCVVLQVLEEPGATAQCQPLIYRSHFLHPALATCSFYLENRSDEELYALALKQIGRLIGFGSIWPDLALVTEEPTFLGPETNRRFQQINRGDATEIPLVECAPETYCWDGPFTGSDEVFSAAATSTAANICPLTVASFHDLKYSVNFGAADRCEFPLGVSLPANPNTNLVDAFIPQTAKIRPHGRLYDFGSEDSPLAGGFSRVTPESLFDPTLGYGWTRREGLNAVVQEAGKTRGPLRLDFIEMELARFEATVPVGLYDVTLVIGDAERSRQLGEVRIESILQSAISVAAGDYEMQTFRTVVRDGRLTLDFTSSDTIERPIINGLIIDRVKRGIFENRRIAATGTAHILFENLGNGGLTRMQNSVQTGEFLCGDGVSLAPNTSYRQWVYMVESKTIGYSVFRTPNRGAAFQLPALQGSHDNGPDKDRDGLSDRAEFICGTSMTRADSDGDGILDGAELDQGLNPLDGRAFPTGVIAALPLLGEAMDLVVASPASSLGARLAYIATGTHGLAIVDISQFDAPSILGQLALPGTATSVTVDSQTNIACVASGSTGLSFIDVSDPMAPRLLRDIDVPCSEVLEFGGVFYAAVGNDIFGYDPTTGDRLSQATVDQEVVTGMAHDNGFLYATSHRGQFYVFEPSSLGLVRRGDVYVGEAGGDLVADNGIVYATSNLVGPGGYNTIDVSDPSNPQPISPSDVPSGQAPSSGIACNGSGLGFLVGFDGPGTSFSSFNIRNPQETYDFIGRIPLPDRPQKVAIAGGVGYVACGPAGLQVINYLAFDNAEVPPTCTLSAPLADVNDDADGIQVYEGSTIPLDVLVDDDVQIRSVDLLINGEIAQTDLSCPFDFFTIAPLVPDNLVSTTFNLQARASDTGGNTALSDTLTIEVIEDTFAPQIELVTPTDGSRRSQNRLSARCVFNEPMDRGSLNPQNIQVRLVSGSPLTPQETRVRGDDQELLLLFRDAIPEGNYQVVINGDAVRDRAGNPVGGGEQVLSSFEIFNGGFSWGFNGSLAEDSGGPALEPIGDGAFQTETVFGREQQVYGFPLGSGLTLSLPAPPPTPAYSFEILLRFDQVSGYRKILDFLQRTDDNGFYVLNGNFIFYWFGNLGDLSGGFAENQYHYLALVRSEEGFIRGYLNGREVVRSDQTVDPAAIDPKDPILNFFVDDSNTSGRESSGGAVAGIRYHDFPLTPSEIADNAEALRTQTPPPEIVANGR